MLPTDSDHPMTAANRPAGMRRACRVSPACPVIAMVFLGWLLAVASSGVLAAPSVEALRVDGTVASQTVGPYMEMFYDADGTLTLEEIQAADAAGRFRPMPSSSPGLGYQPGATWVRFTIANTSTRELERWLQAGFLLQEYYNLYLVDGDGQIERMDNGTKITLAERPLHSRKVLFPIRLDPGETRTAYIRIAGRAATFLSFTLWEPAAYVDRSTFWLVLKYSGLGATAIVLVFGFLDWRLRRRSGLLAVIPAHGLSIALSFWLDGFGTEWLLPDSGLFINRIAHTLALLVLLFHAVFARAFLALEQSAPKSDRCLRYLANGLVIACILPILNAPLAASISVVLIAVLILTGVASLNACGQGALGRSYLLAWGGLWMSFSLRIIQHLGWMPGITANLELHFMGLYISGFAMAYALYLDVESIRRQFRATQAKLLAREQGETERLALAVKTRTEELRSAIERAESSSRAKSVFLSTVSHEFRTPLHTILGYAELLAKQVDSGLASKLAVIGRSGTQLLRLIDEVLDYSRGESQPVQILSNPFNLRALARHLEETGCLLAGQNGNHFSLEMDATLPSNLEGGEKRLTQILLNLIDNACKYTRFGSVTLRIVPDKPAQLDANGRRRHWIRFEVKDTGVGISDQDRNAIFEPFSRGADGNYQPGVGLGLAITRQLVEAMGGRIDFESKIGQGSRFFLSLAFLETDLPAVEPIAAPDRISGYRGRRLTVVVADDIAENREYFKDLLNNWDIQPVLTASGDATIERCKRRDPAVDAVLVDQFMPQRNGWEILKAIRETPETSSLPVILVSAAQPQRPAGFPQGIDFDAILLKPVFPRQLAEILQPLLKIEWIYAEPETIGIADLDEVYLSPEQIKEFQALLTQGRIVALRRWAQGLIDTDPRCVAFSSKVAQLAASVDLDALHRLLKQLSSQQQNTDRG